MTTTQIDLPEMTVESRESDKSHGIQAPDLSDANMEVQVSETCLLNQLAIRNNGKRTHQTTNILRKYIPVETDHHEIIQAVEAVSWYKTRWEVSKFVIDDMCSEWFNKALKYVLKKWQKHKESLGFIDGSGIWYLEAYRDRLKVTLEKCFDAKYFYKVKRPLEHLRDKWVKIESLANAIHPWHRSYPAWHGTKFLTAVEVLNDVFHLDSECYKILLIDACVNSMWRSWNLIHYPMDNLAWWVLTTLKEFQ